MRALAVIVGLVLIIGGVVYAGLGVVGVDLPLAARVIVVATGVGAAVFGVLFLRGPVVRRGRR